MRPDFVKLGKRLTRKVYLSPINNDEDMLTADYLFIRPLTMMEELDAQVKADALITEKKLEKHERWTIRVAQICRLQVSCYKEENCAEKFFESTADLFKLPEIQINYIADQYDQVDDLANPSCRALNEIVDPKERKKELDRRIEELKKNSITGTTMSTAELLDLCHFLADLWVLEELQKPSSAVAKKTSPSVSGST